MTPENVIMTMDDNEPLTEEVDLLDEALHLLSEQGQLDQDANDPIELDDYDREMLIP